MPLDSEVVQAGVPEHAFRSRRVVVFKFQDREVHMTVAQLVALCGGRVDLAGLLQAKAFDVELRCRLRVLRSDSDMPDPCHCSPPFLSNIRARALARLSTWKIAPAGARRTDRGMAQTYSRHFQNSLIGIYPLFLGPVTAKKNNSTMNRRAQGPKYASGETE